MILRIGLQRNSVWGLVLGSLIYVDLYCIRPVGPWARGSAGRAGSRAGGRSVGQVGGVPCPSSPQENSKYQYCGLSPDAGLMHISYSPLVWHARRVHFRAVL
jgi:hypothetical protein